MSFRSRERLALAVRSIVESLEERRLLTTVLSTTTSFAGTDQHLTVTYDGPVANLIGPVTGQVTQGALQLLNLTKGGLAVGTLRTATSAGDTVATYRKSATGPLIDGWYESQVESPLLDAADHSKTFKFLNADFNDDGHVDFTDFTILQAGMGSTAPATFGTGDANYDGAVNFSDYLIFQGNFGQSLPDFPTQAGQVSIGVTTGNTLDVAWGASTDPVEKYYVYRSTDGVTFAKVHEQDAADPTAWQDTGLTSGQKYWYRVRAYTTDGGVSPSTMKASGVASVPTPPVGFLAAAGIGPGRISLKWHAVSEPVKGYRVYRSQDPAFVPSAATFVSFVDGTKTQFTNSGLSLGHRYYYKLVTVALTGVLSAPSLNVSALSQNEGRGISDGATPFDPTAHDSDGDGIVDALDDDNDNDKITDETDTDDDNDGIPTTPKPTTATATATARPTTTTPATTPTRPTTPATPTTTTTTSPTTTTPAPATLASSRPARAGSRFSPISMATTYSASATPRTA